MSQYSSKSKRKEHLRRCVGCERYYPQQKLLRITFSKQGFVISPSPKQEGRSAYLCRTIACFTKAKKHRGLERSFKKRVEPTIYDLIDVEITHEKG